MFYFVTKRMPYLCGFWRFANAYKAILMGKEEYKIFNGILLSWECSEQEKKLIDNMIGFIEKMRNPQHEPQHKI